MSLAALQHAFQDYVLHGADGIMMIDGQIAEIAVVPIRWTVFIPSEATRELPKYA